jgi:hypothetical protein
MSRLIRSPIPFLSRHDWPNDAAGLQAAATFRSILLSAHDAAVVLGPLDVGITPTHCKSASRRFRLLPSSFFPPQRSLIKQ